MSSNKGRRRGQSMVEFALTLPALLMILLGVIETALVIQAHLVVQHAAREAARFAATYQPPQGACMDLDGDGVLQDGINDAVDGDPNDLVLAEARDPDGDGYPYCPSEGDGYAHADLDETESEYMARRVQLIKMRAREAAEGLRVRVLAFAPEAFANQYDEAGFFGVGVWGFPSFQVDCSDYRPWGPVESPATNNPCLDHPGIEGGTVRVYVRHNAEVLDPLYRRILEYVPVQAEAQMVNEGVQVGFGDVPPPIFERDPTFDEPDGGGASDYTVILTPPDASNILPGDDSEQFQVSVKQSGTPVSGETVSFRTDFGSFSSGDVYIEVATDVNGNASVTLQSGSAGRANLRAWIQDGGDNLWNGEPADSATCTWIQPGHSITLTPAEAENILPDDRAHDLTATVLDEEGQPVWGATVGFHTSAGAFLYSGDEPFEATVRTDSRGEAGITLYGNYSETATIRAWIDDGNGELDAGETADEATKTWMAIDAYITVSDYEVYAGEAVDVGVMKHPNGDYDLYWCEREGGATSEKVSTVTTDAAGNRTGIGFTVPDGTSGQYVFETHSAGGGCGDESDLVARSAEVRVVVARPDLEIEILDPGMLCPETLFQVTAVVTNTSLGSTDQRFEVDFHIDPGHDTGGSLAKQWISGLGAGMTQTVTAVGWVAPSPSIHTIQAFVDPRNTVSEMNEYNNGAWMSKPAGSTYGGLCETNELVVIPATHQSASNSAGSSHYWEIQGSRFVGLPNVGDGYYDQSETGDSPVVSFPVNFTHPGTYRVWVEGDSGGSGSDDSVWVSLDGLPPDNNYRITGFGSDLSWASEIHGAGGYPTLNVGSAGEHTVEVRMREDGFEWTRILLTTDSNYTPSGSESATECEAECPVRHDPAPWGEQACKPPGSVECRQLFEGGDFEDDGTMYAAWDWVDSAPWPRSYGEGVQSMVLQDSQGWPPECRAYAPTLEQTVTLPDLMGTCTETMSTTLVVRGYYQIDESQTGCSISETVDVDDELYVELEGVSELITTGAMPESAHGSGGFASSSGSTASLSHIPSANPSLQRLGAAETIPLLLERQQPGDAVSGTYTWLRKGLFSTVTPAVRDDRALGSQVIHSTSFDSDWAGWSAQNNGGSVERTDQDGPYSGSFHVHAEGGTYGLSNPASLSRSISTEGFTNIQVSYWRKDYGLEWDEDWLRVRWYDGSTWRDLEWDNEVGSTWTQRTFDLGGTTASDNSSFELQFEFAGDHSSDEFYLDDVTVTGDPISVPDVTVDFSAAGYSVDESVGMATITATLSETSTEPIVVDYATFQDSAQSPDDYTSVADILTFAAGEREATFQVPIIDDSLYEGAETLTLTLESTAVEWVERFALASGTSVDTGTTAWSVSSGSGTFAVDSSQHFHASNTVTERAWQSEDIDISGAGPVEISVAVRSDGDSYLESDGSTHDWLYIKYRVDGGSEQTLATYDGAIGGWRTVTEAGVTGDAVQVIIYANTTASNEHYYWDDVSVVSSGGGVAIGPNSPATLTIVDDDPMPAVSFGAADYTVGELAGSATISAALSAPAGVTVTVDYATADGTATAGQDYAAASGTLVFSPGTTTASLQVAVTDDSLEETTETLTLSLSNPSGATLGDPDSTTLSIVDDDTDVEYLVDFSAADYSVVEGTVTATITATLSPAAVGSVAVNYATTDGTASAGSDYVAAAGVLTFESGETVRTFEVPILDDTVYEGAETVTLNLFREPLEWVEDFGDLPSGSTEDTGDTAWSVSGGGGTFEVDSGHSFHVSNTGGEREWQSEAIDISNAGPVELSLAVWSDGSDLDADGDFRDWVDVFYQVDGGTVQPLYQHSGAIDGVETIQQGGLTGNSLRVIVRSNTTASTEHYYFDEIAVLGGTGGLTFGPNTPATLTITDDDPEDQLAVDFTRSSYVVSEDGGSVVIETALSAAVTETVTVGYRTVDGTATAGSDYEAISGTLTFENGVRVLTFTVSINDDDNQEQDESLTLELHDPVGAVVGPHSPATITILDNDGFSPSDWIPFSVDFGGLVDVPSLVGQATTVSLYGTQDGDRNGTWFFVDNLELELCNEWPVPAQAGDLGTIAGTVRVNGWTQAGVAVWAYNQDTGETFQTVSLGDEDRFSKGSFHHFNISPGDYMVYAEVWQDGILYWDVQEVLVVAGGQSSVDLDLR